MHPLIVFFISILISLSFVSSSDVSKVCKATRFSETCETTLANLTKNLSPIDMIQIGLLQSSQNLKTAKGMVQAIVDENSNVNITASAKSGIEVLTLSEYRLEDTTVEVITGGGIKDARTWVSAVLGNEAGCIGGFSKFLNDSQVNSTVTYLEELTEITSNTLAFLVNYDKYGNETDSWVVPKTEREGVWEDGNNAPNDVNLTVPDDLEANVTVCKGWNKCYKTIQSAVDAAPDYATGKNKFVIKIEEGVYDEIVRVWWRKKNIVFIGDGMGKTFITGNLSVGLSGVGTSNTPTVAVFSDRFMARDITFQNTAGVGANQAVAFRSLSDLSIIESCEFLGNQDTLYPHSLRQYYKACRVEGNVDFIFGNAAAIFDDCLINIRPRLLNPEKGASNPITAHGRTDPTQNTGFVFQNCYINGTKEFMDLYYNNTAVHKNYLGRPWKVYARTVFIKSYLGDLIRRDGWMPWDGDLGLSTLYYGEYQSWGPGAANISGRVYWSNQLPTDHINSYSIANFIQGDKWL